MTMTLVASGVTRYVLLLWDEGQGRARDEGERRIGLQLEVVETSRV